MSHFQHKADGAYQEFKSTFSNLFDRDNVSAEWLKTEYWMQASWSECANMLILWLWYWNEETHSSEGAVPLFYPPFFVFVHNWLVVGGGTDARDGGSSHDAENGHLCILSANRGTESGQWHRNTFPWRLLRPSQRQSGHTERAGCMPASLLCSNKIEKRREWERKRVT